MINRGYASAAPNDTLAMDHQWTMGNLAQPTHHHYQQHHQQAQQNNQAQPQYMPSPDQEIALARSQMFESVHHLSTSLRNAANQCENFVKIIARHHPSAAATAFASNVGADFLALASGNGLGGGGGLHPSATGTQAHHHHHAANQAMTVAPTSGTPGRKPMSKEEKKALRKERKANRDPNAPKRPPSAYLLFQNEIREDMRQRYKDLTYSEVLGKISEAWKALTEEQRKIYQDKTVESMARWNQEKKSHQSSGFVQSDVIANEFDESESDESDDATGQHGHLLANGLIQFDNKPPRMNGMKSNSSKLNRKM